MSKKILSRTFYCLMLASAAMVVVACGRSGVSMEETSKLRSVPHSDKQKTIKLMAEEPPFRFSMYPIYDSESESLVYFQIENLNEKTFVQDAEVVGYFIGLDGESQKKTLKPAPDNKRYVASLPLKHHENYEVQVFVQFPDKRKFSPTFSFHCADPLPEVDWLNSEEGKEK